jgi:hypothetical protein
MKDNCKHENFKVQAQVNRLTDEEGGEVKKYSVDIEIHCADCFMPFRFIGLPGGVSPSQPTVNFDGTELRAPITLAG